MTPDDDIQPVSKEELDFIEAEYEENRFDMDEPEFRGDFCPECGGTGLDRYESFHECDYCKGEGYIWW